jgi:hypothetical protein
VPTDTDIVCEVKLDGSGEGYIASLRRPGTQLPVAMLRLPRSVVENAVLEAVQTVLEVRSDGSVAAYLESGDLRTLSSTALSDLVAAAVSPDALGAEEDGMATLGRLEAELERALGIVRRVQR